MKFSFIPVSILALCLGFFATAQEAKITVDASKPGVKVSPTLWGVFFEDINCSADGGIYAELIRNRSFENTEKPEYWHALRSGTGKVDLTVSSERPVSAKNPHSLKVTITEPGIGRAGIANNGFWGIAVKKDEVFNLRLWGRADASFVGPLTVTLESGDNVVYAKESLPPFTAEWKEYSLSLTTSETDPEARLVISTASRGTFWLDMVSLFPKNTWKGHGLRPDLAETIAALKPSFVRFPGGCWVEGDTMDKAYRWKRTIGKISERVTQFNIWNYYATHGLGFHEYLQMCEDLGAEPLFVINTGMSHKENVPMNKMNEFVQDALDAIEYCNGPENSKWGAVRARAGHPAPFNLKYMEIGNENGGPAYQERYGLMVKAIKERYPDMHLIANEWGGVPKEVPVEIVDEHYYNTPEFFMGQANRYDKYDRKGPKVYVGEYAVTQGCGLGNMRAAVGEAAFMTGLERNSDVVAMASYAPLLVNVNHRGWNPDLICFDSSRVYGIPSYYVQKMFSENRGDTVLPVDVDASSTGPSEGMVGVGTWRTQAEFKDIKVVEDGKTLFESDFSKGTNDWKFLGGKWSAGNGTLKQDSDEENVHAVAGSPNWSNYTLTLKARKTGGTEGFLILFRVQNETERIWWNIGGWQNTGHGLEIGADSLRVPGKIETGRWYDIRVEVKDFTVKCYLDNQFIQEAVFPRQKVLFASATKEASSGDLILKVVNSSAKPVQTALNLTGFTPNPEFKVIELASEKPTDENSIDAPQKVVPVVKTCNLNETASVYSFPGNSVTILRGHPKK